METEAERWIMVRDLRLVNLVLLPNFRWMLFHVRLFFSVDVLFIYMMLLLFHPSQGSGFRFSFNVHLVEMDVSSRIHRRYFSGMFLDNISKRVGLDLLTYF